MKSSVVKSKEPSRELQRLANVYVAAHRQSNRSDRNRDTGNEILAEWCEHLGRHSPELLDLPVIQLAKAVVRANMQSIQT